VGGSIILSLSATVGGGAGEHDRPGVSWKGMWGGERNVPFLPGPCAQDEMGVGGVGTPKTTPGPADGTKMGLKREKGTGDRGDLATRQLWGRPSRSLR